MTPLQAAAFHIYHGDRSRPVAYEILTDEGFMELAELAHEHIHHQHRSL